MFRRLKSPPHVKATSVAPNKKYQMKKTWEFINHKLESNHKVMLLVVIDTKGSSPGQAGFSAAVANDGTMTGSIGGGQIEYQLIEKAKKELQEENPQISLLKQVHRAEAKEDRSGMICSGEQWIAFYPVSAIDKTTIDLILDSMEKSNKGILHFNQEGFTFKPGETEHHKHQDPVTSNEEWIYSKPIGDTNQLFIFGAGHVGIALSDIANTLGFVVHLFDNRKDVNTMAMDTSARVKKIINYKDSAQHVPEGNNIYVVIMTFGHKSDELVLRQFLPKNIKYLGMMGSRKKVDAIFKNLENEGYEKELMEKIHAPIGLIIGSQTPYEIAISVVAEIIATKNK